MLLDYYLVPLVEISISIVIPLILTLKTLQLTTNVNINDNYSRHILTYWLTYWFLFCFIQSVGTNNHVRLCFSIFYISQYKAISPYLVEFYQSTLVPQISNILLKTMNFRLNAEQIDNYANFALEQVCFNDHLFDKFFSIIKIGPAHDEGTIRSKSSSNWLLNSNFSKSHRKSSPLNLNPINHSRVASGNTAGTPENIIPLEIQKPRAIKKLPEEPPQNLELKKSNKKSSDNLRAKTSSSSLNGNYMKSQSTGATSRKSSKVVNGASRNVSTDDTDTGNTWNENLEQPPSNFNDSGTNLLVHGYNNDPFVNNSDTVFTTPPQLKPEKSNDLRKGLKSFFT